MPGSPGPWPWPAVERGRSPGTRADAPALPVPDPDPTHPRTHPWGDPTPLLLLRTPVFFGPSDRGGGRLEWCVAVVLRLLRLCDGMFMQPFVGRGLVATCSGWLLRWFCSRCTPASLRSLGRRFDVVSRPHPPVTKLAVVLPPQFGLVASGCRSRRVRWTTFAICVVWKRCSLSSMQQGLPTSPCVTGPHAIGLGLMPVSVQAAVPGCVAERSIML